MKNKYCLKELTEENLKDIFGYECKDFVIGKDLNKEMLIKLGMEYAIVYNFDKVITDHISNIRLDYDNIIEAIFFNDNAEIRVFGEDYITGTIFKEHKDSKCIDGTYRLYPRYCEGKQGKNYAKELLIKKYISYDDDNQAYISYLKPCKWIFAGGEIDEVKSE